MIAWLMDPDTKEIYNSGTRFDPDITSSVDDLSKHFPLDVYPNPASADINFELPDDIFNRPVRIFDVNGRIVFDRLLSGSQFTIDTYDLPAGTYNIEVLMDNRKFVGKFNVMR